MNIARPAACSATLSTLLLALSAQCASAAPAVATTNVNLRQGPGTTYTVITTIPAGSNVDVGNCNGQWCQVTWQGQNGYLIATSIGQGGEEDVPPGAAPPPGAVPPPGPNGPVAAYPPPPPGYYGPPVYVAPQPYYGPYYYGYGPYGGWGGRYRRW